MSAAGTERVQKWVKTTVSTCLHNLIAVKDVSKRWVMRLGQSGSVEFGVDMDRVRDLSILSLVQSPIIIASTEILYVCVCLCVSVCGVHECVRACVCARARIFLQCTLCLAFS